MRYFPVMQELVLFTDFTNDILSYYKEFILHREKGNFVGNFADTHEMQQLDVLQHLTGYTPKVRCSSFLKEYSRMLTSAVAQVGLFDARRH